MRRVAWGALLALALLSQPLTAAELWSKTFEFREGVNLEIGAAVDEGVRIDAVQFRIPAVIGERLTRTGGLVEVEVAVANSSEVARKVGVAIALYGGEGRLLAVASGGSKLGGIKPGRVRMFKLVFDNVYAEAHLTRTFQISVESKN